MAMHDSPFHLLTTPWFWSAFSGWVLAQAIKMALGFRRTRRLHIRYLVSTGGMPSAHSAMVCALATAIGLTEGFGRAVTMLAFAFAAVTMFDAAVVRRATGQQAKILNQMLDEMFETHRVSEKRLKELLGHTRLEVFVGMLIGVLCAMLVVSRWPA
jgi:uncharacterized protein